MRKQIKELVQWLDYWADDCDKSSLRYSRIQTIRARLIAESKLAIALNDLLSASDNIATATHPSTYNWDNFFVQRRKTREALNNYNNPQVQP